MMKKIIIISLLAVFGLSLWASEECEYVPFVREGVKWVYVYQGPRQGDENSREDKYYTLEMKGDTVIGGKSYKPMHLYSGDSISESNDSVPVYLREEDKVVYAIIPEGRSYPECPVGFSTVTPGVEFFLYDFNVPESDIEVGRHHIVSDYHRFHISKVDTLQVGHRICRRYCDFTNVYYFIIDGYGYAGHASGTPLALGGECRMSHIIEDGELVFKTHLYQEDEPEDYEYVPFVREGVKWNYWCRFPYHPQLGEQCVECRYTLELRGDSVINGKSYKALHCYSGDAINEEHDTVVVYLREENKVVYAIMIDDNRYAHCPVGKGFYLGSPTGSHLYQTGVEYVLYDFNDPSWFYRDDGYLYSDYVQVGGKLRKRFLFA